MEEREYRAKLHALSMMHQHAEALRKMARDTEDYDITNWARNASDAYGDATIELARDRGVLTGFVHEDVLKILGA